MRSTLAVIARSTSSGWTVASASHPDELVDRDPDDLAVRRVAGQQPTVETDRGDRCGHPEKGVPKERLSLGTACYEHTPVSDRIRPT